MNWETKGMIFKTESFATMPTALVLKDVIRLFFAERDEQGFSHPAYIDLDFDLNVISKIEKDILELGDRTFDDSGIMPSSIIQHDERYFMYYVGWNSGDFKYKTAIGLAISEDGLNFTKPFDGPVLDRNIHDPYFVTTPWVTKTNYFDWTMWYASGDGYIDELPQYNIKFATSKCGVRWSTYGENISQGIFNITEKKITCRPCIVGHDMWFCYRSKDKNYSIAHAKWEWKTGIGSRWVKTEEEIKPNSDWDSQMMAYPNVIKLEDKLIMFYNGNSFGKYGVGYAVCDFRDE